MNTTRSGNNSDNYYEKIDYEFDLDYKKIGERIRKFRRASNITQEHLAEMVDISVTHMSHIETGNTKLSLPVCVKIAKALNISIDDIITDSSDINQGQVDRKWSTLLEEIDIRDSDYLYNITDYVYGKLKEYTSLKS
jgi:transcriptional regulator with XRE-family HTH domain